MVILHLVFLLGLTLETQSAVLEQLQLDPDVPARRATREQLVSGAGARLATRDQQLGRGQGLQEIQQNADEIQSRNIRSGRGICLCTSQCPLSPSNRLTTLHALNNEFYISFEFKVKKFNEPPGHKKYNIIHLKTGSKSVPSIWIKRTVTADISIGVSFDGIPNVEMKANGLAVGLWYKMEICQKWNTMRMLHTWEVKLNRAVVHVQTISPQPLPTVLVYASEIYVAKQPHGHTTLVPPTGNPPLDGFLRYFYINPDKCEMPGCALE